jgi:hypothetical protein
VLLESRAASSPAPAALQPPQRQASVSTNARDDTASLDVVPLQPGNSSTAPNTAEETGRTTTGRGLSPNPAQDPVGEESAALDPQRKEQNQSEEAKPRTEAQGRKAALEEDTPTLSQNVASSDMTYALMQKKRQQEARDERARILQRVENDKVERRKREAERKAEAKAKEEGEPTSDKAGTSRPKPSTSSQSKECAIQIRLFDGSTIRSRFPSSGTLRGDVRPWIDERQAENAPYTFKHVLTPLPNKDISISDEEQSLQSQGLTPSATLILVPVQGYVSAYEDGGNTGILPKTVSTGYGLVSSGVGMISSLLGSFLGGSSTSSPQLESPPDAARMAPPARSVNMRTVRDQNRRDENQFYNGNSVSSPIV